MNNLHVRVGLCLIAMIGGCALLGSAQTASDAASSATSIVNTAVVPQFVKYSGVLTSVNGQPLTGVVGVTFSLYSEAQGGTPLWMEIQNVNPNSSGHYSVMLGSTTSGGLPQDVFANGEARWLGVQIEGQAEQPRVLLAAVPYALKARDAETIGGLPASAFVLAGSQGAASSGTKASAEPAAANATKKTTTPANPDVTGVGTAGYIPVWDTTSDIIDSVLFQKGTSIGVGTATPAVPLDVAGKGAFRDTLTLVPKGTDNTLAVNGTTFAVSSAGSVTFIASQKFPGTGTITGITTASGSGLSGGGTSGTLTLAIPAAGVTNAMLANSKVTVPVTAPLTGGGAATLGGSATSISLKACAANQVYVSNGTTWSCATAATGTVTSVASGAGLTGGPITGSGTLSIATGGVTNAMLANSKVTVTAGTDLTGGGSATLGGSAITLNLNTATVPTLAAANNFTTNQTISGPSSAVSLNVNSSGGLSDPQVEIVQNNTSDGARLRLTAAGSTNYWDLYGYVGSSPTLNFWNGGAGLNVLQLFPTSVEANANLYVNNSAGLGDGDGVDAYGTGAGVFATSTLGDAVIGYGSYDGAYFNGPDGGTYSENDTDSNGSTAAYGFEFGGTANDIGVYGYAASGNGIGVYGQDYEASISGASQGFELGLWGDSGNTDAIAVLGSADAGWALYGVNNSDTNATLFVSNAGTGGTGAVVQAVGKGGMCTADVNGGFSCTGGVAAVAPVNGGASKVALSAIHSPENWFEDAGSGQLSGGQAVVNIESVFGETVNTGVEYHVFLTPNGDCKGLYVAQKSPTSFVVKELGGGTSSIAFDYRIMAKRIGFETVRLADKTQLMTPQTRATKSFAKAIPSARDIQKQAQEHAPRRTPVVAASAGKKK